MEQFEDNQGRTWEVAIDVTAIKRVRDALEVDLTRIIDGKLLERFSEDPVLLVDVLYVLCQPQAEEREVTDENFGRAMAGDAIDDATTALLEELINFFPKVKRRTLHKVLKKIRKLETKAAEDAEKMIESNRMDRLVEAKLAKVDRDMEHDIRQLGGSSGDAPVSSESTPDP